MVMTSESRQRGRTAGQDTDGAADPSLTAAGGMLASNCCGKLGLIEALDEAMGPVKQRQQGSGRAVRC